MAGEISRALNCLFARITFLFAFLSRFDDPVVTGHSFSGESFGEYTTSGDALLEVWALPKGHAHLVHGSGPHYDAPPRL